MAIDWGGCGAIGLFHRGQSWCQNGPKDRVFLPPFGRVERGSVFREWAILEDCSLESPGDRSERDAPVLGHGSRYVDASYET
jgi:hypothetical protein